MRRFRVYYDREYDRLMIAGKTEKDVMSGSVRLLNVVLDFNTKNKVVNAELLHASEYLKSIGVDTSILKKITGGKLIMKQLRNGYEIIFLLSSNNKDVPIPYNVHLPSKSQISVSVA